jgi:TolB protein
MKQNSQITTRLVIFILLLLLLLNGAAIVRMGWPALSQGQLALSPPSQTPTRSTQPLTQPGNSVTTLSPTPSGVPATATYTPVPLHIGNPQTAASLKEEGVLLLALRDGAQVHLFAYHPDLLPLTRLTDSPWDEIHPALSPDGSRLAYSSRQNGYWDLYIRDLISGETQKLTDTPEYEGSPTWSPDGQWMAYEAYRGDNLDIFLQSLADLKQAPIQLTNDPGADSSPAWSPGGREIAFVSNRTGNLDRRSQPDGRPLLQPLPAP